MHKNCAKTDTGAIRCMRLQTKLGVAISTLVIIVSALLTFVLFLSVRQQLREGIRQQLRNIANIAALQIEPDAHASLIDRSQENSPEYVRIKWSLQKIRNSCADIRYIYTWRFNEAGQLVFVVDAETDPDKISHIGDIYHCRDEAALIEKLKNLKAPSTDVDFSADRWGVWLSGYAPFYARDGRREGILGLDMAATDVIALEWNFLRIVLFAFVCTVPLVVMMGWVLGRKLTTPIKNLTIASERIAAGDLNYRVNLHCSNEIGMLSSAFNKMAQNLQEEIQARGREITERSHAERKLAELNKQLEATVENLSSANRELAEVAYIAAHDLKTPVRAVGSLASMIHSDYKDKLDDEAKNELNMIVERAQRMDELLDGVLEYCRLQRVISNCSRVDTNEVVKKVIAQISLPRNVEIIVENKLPVIECEHRHIELLFSHLITNAVKFIDKPMGLVKIACVEKDGFWRFSVTDNGCGIEHRHFQRIFKLFQKLDANDKVAGVGIGLPMAKKIVELYQGVIWIESQPGVGSTFFFALPMKQSSDDMPVQTCQVMATT